MLILSLSPPWILGSDDKSLIFTAPEFSVSEALADHFEFFSSPPSLQLVFFRPCFASRKVFRLPSS